MLRAMVRDTEIYRRFGTMASVDVLIRGREWVDPAPSVRVKPICVNHLPHPQRLEVQLSNRFVALKRSIRDLVQEEVIGSRGSCDECINSRSRP